MANKNLKKEYDKRRVLVMLGLNFKEASVLDEMMSKEDWGNRAGFIKDKIFAGSLDTKFEKMIRTADAESVKTILKNIIIELDNTLGYLNYRFTYELQELEKLNGEETAHLNKKINKMKEWKAAVIGRTDEISDTLRIILRQLGIKIEKDRREAVRFAPDEVLKKAAKNWNDIHSPEIHELVRRQHEKFDKEEGNIDSELL